MFRFPVPVAAPPAGSAPRSPRSAQPSCPGAALVLDAVGFDPPGYDLVVTGEGRVDSTTLLGKAPGEVARRSLAAGTRCVVFGGLVAEPLPDVETVALSGDPGACARRSGGAGET